MTDDFRLAPRWLKVAAGAAEATRRIWCRVPAPAKAVTWMTVWWLGRLLDLPLPSGADAINVLHHLGR